MEIEGEGNQHFGEEQEDQKINMNVFFLRHMYLISVSIYQRSSYRLLRYIGGIYVNFLILSPSSVTLLPTWSMAIKVFYTNLADGFQNT
jgi:hypothetical protein